jgi:hypothetical protein
MGVFGQRCVRSAVCSVSSVFGQLCVRSAVFSVSDVFGQRCGLELFCDLTVLIPETVRDTS